MGHSFSVHDCDNVVDLVEFLGKPKIKKRLNVSKLLYIWDHYVVTVREHDGRVISIKDKSVTSITSNEDNTAKTTEIC